MLRLDFPIRKNTFKTVEYLGDKYPPVANTTLLSFEILFPLITQESEKELGWRERKLSTNSKVCDNFYQEEKMVRGPCCEKMGLKKGPWTREEDEILISYIQQHGHGNWRALPKQAGLLRCGKSCRLRWTNYLRPDIKRGNFSKEEEETIIKLHEMLGNRWSAIVARLPGRTDNEIKNVWHTHLKKRLQNYQTTTQVSKRHYPVTKTECDSNAPGQSKQPDSCQTRPNTNMLGHPPVLPQRSSSELSSVTTSSSFVVKEQQTDYSSENLIDKSFWSQALLAEDSGIEQFDSRRELQLEFPILPLLNMENVGTKSSKIDDGMDFWYDIFTRAEELLEF